MVKINQIPIMKERIDLDELPETNILKAVSERMQEQSSDKKTGGLIIDFVQKDGKMFSQKYGNMSGTLLNEAMQKLKLEDTTQLQQDWYKYKMTIMKMGFPRYIPIAKE